MRPERTTFKRWENIGGRAAEATDDYHALQPSTARRSVLGSEASEAPSDDACVARKGAPRTASLLALHPSPPCRASFSSSSRTYIFSSARACSLSIKRR